MKWEDFTPENGDVMPAAEEFALINIIESLNETVTISREEYDSLREDAAELRRLEAAGVDNWEGY